MKIVREHINETMGFTEDSDPIKDLGIGGIDVYKEWHDLNDEYDNGNIKDLAKEWRKVLEEIFVGKHVTGNFHQGNSDSYGGLQRLTTRKPVDRVEDIDSEGDGAFALVTNDPGVYKYATSDGNYINKDEVWYFALLDENKGIKIFVR
jgi:hypothetical protein